MVSLIVMAISKPIIETEIWQQAFGLNEEMKIAITNPNTDFMTKLLFDARFFQKKFGKEVSDWSNAIFKFKWALVESGKSGAELASVLGLPENEISEIGKYLVGMGELTEQNGVYTLNLKSPFSKMFGK